MSSSTHQTQKQRSHTGKILVDIIAGTCAGINVTIVGHPFDTLKVRLQTQPIDKPVYSGLVDCFKKTIKWEGLSGLYKGVQSPLIGAIFFRVTMFLSFGEAKRFFSQNGKRKMNIIEYYYCGSIAWGSGVIVECPIDLFKTQMQIQIIRSKSIPNFVPEFSGIIDCFKKVIKTNGIKGAYQGIVPHLLRNIPAGAVHLGTFEWLRLIYADKYNVPVSQLPFSITMFAGSVGGILFWLLFYPFDVLKSTIQGDSPFKEKRKYHGLLDAINKLYAEGGSKRFFKGLSPCMLRAIPANSVLLLTSSYLAENL